MCICVFYILCCVFYCDVSGRLVLLLLINWLIDWLMVAPLLILNQFSNFLTIRSFSKFAAKYLLKIPPHLICVATLPCETLTSENERQLQTNTVINNKLQGTLVTYLRCGGISVTKKGLSLSLPENFFNRWIFGIVSDKKVDFVVHFFRLLAAWWPGEQNARDNHLLAGN